MEKLEKSKYLSKKRKNGKWVYKYKLRHILSENKKLDELIEKRREQAIKIKKRAESGNTNIFAKRSIERSEKILDSYTKVVNAIKKGEMIFHNPKSDQGNFAIIHPSSRKGWKWQASFFDERGAYHHESANDIASLLMELESMGTFTPGKPPKGNQLIRSMGNNMSLLIFNKSKKLIF